MQHLEEAVRTIARTAAAQDVLQGLLRGLREAAPRGAIYLVRPEGISGWSSFGYPSDLAFEHRAFACPPGEGWLGTLAADPPGKVITRDDHGGPPSRAITEAAETMAGTVNIQDRIVAIAVGQRAAGETPWCPATLGTLIVTVQLRLELSLVERRAAALGSESRRGQAGSTSAAPQPSPAQNADVVTLCPVEDGQTLRDAVNAIGSAGRTAPGGSSAMASARRFARLVATDIKLYNEQDVVLGRREGDLGDRLRGSLDRGRASFLERHADLGEQGLQVLYEAFVQVLAGGEASLFDSLDDSPPRA